jgi:enoyl-[acyl-carrier-protein] reductase (NADH)
MPEEMAEPLIFLNSNMARFISGQNLIVDFGYQAAVDVGQKPSLL